MRLALFCLTIIAGITSCKKDNLDMNAYWECHKSQNLDTAAISALLVGSWKWAKQSCEGTTRSADKDIKVTFNNNHTFIVKHNSNTLTQGTWNLVPVESNSWGLNLSSSSEYLFGRILFCNNLVLFNDSYRDGCDNLFKWSN